MFYKQIFFLTLLSVLATVSCVDKETCDLNDEICLTRAVDLMIKFTIAGNKSWEIDSLEQLHEKTINVDLSHNIHYTFTDVYFYGMKDCTVQRFKFIENLSWKCYMICPKLILKSDYVEKGVIDLVPFEGTGNVSITYDNYHVDIGGSSEAITGFDGKLHFNITNYQTDSMEVKDKAVYEFTNISSTDNEKSEKAHKCLNENWKKNIDDILYPTLQPFIDRLLCNVNKYLATVPRHELYYKNQ